VSKHVQKELKFLENLARQHNRMSLEQYLAQEDRFSAAYDHLSHGRAEEAIEGGQQVLAVEPRHVQSHGNLGIAYAMRGNRERALEYLERALELDPSYAPAAGNRMRVLALAPGQRLEAASIQSVEYYRQRYEKEHASSSSSGPGSHDASVSLVEDPPASLTERVKRWFSQKAG